MAMIVKLVGPKQRSYAKSLIDGSDTGWVMTLKDPSRSLDQNAKLWAMLGDLSKQEIGGIKATPDEWKCLAMHACGYECQFLPGLLDGRPFPIGFRSSGLTVRQMAALITWLTAYGDERGVVWSEPNPEWRT